MNLSGFVVEIDYYSGGSATKVKSYFSKFILIIFSTFLGFVVLEIGFRWLLFCDISAFNNLRIPDNYANYFSDDDYYKLVYLFGNKPPDNPHPLLGWTADFSGDTYIHNDVENLRGRRPVLLYGDSFAARSYFQNHLNNDEEFSEEHYLLNYAVGGYGPDQIFLLFQNSVHLYDDPFVVMSLMTLDLDRSILSVRGGQKPYFRIENDELKLSGVPINSDPYEFFANNPPEITSYVYRRILYAYMSEEVKSLLRPGNDRIEEKKAINEKIILGIIKELRANDIDFVFLIFHPHWPGVSTLDSETDWRDPFLRELLHRNNIPYIWSKEIFRQDAQNKQFSFDDYIIPGNGHPTPYFNGLIAEEIKSYILEHSQINPLSNSR